MVAPGQTFVATSRVLLQQTATALPGFSSEHIIAEPSSRNTLGALVWAAANLRHRFGNDWSQVSLAILTADHMIAPSEAFVTTVNKALNVAESTGGLVTIGIQPTRPATEYGYVQLSAPLEDGTWLVSQFKEKPDAKTAESYIKGGGHLWNSGMFFWTLEAFFTALATNVPNAAEAAERIVAALKSGDEAAAVGAFEEIEKTSIDYALMERHSKVYVVTAEFQWDDLGSWDALERSLTKDADGNVAVGQARLVDATGNFVYNEAGGVRVSLLGTEGLIVVVSEGEVMVCKKNRAQDVKDLAD